MELLPAYTNNEINSEKNHETYTCLQLATHRRIDDLSSAPRYFFKSEAFL